MDRRTDGRMKRVLESRERDLMKKKCRLFVSMLAQLSLWVTMGKIELIDDLETSLIEGMSESGFNSKKLG